MRVVLDNNILVSAAITPTPGKQARDILDQAEEHYTLLLSDFMLHRLEQVLHYDRIQKKYPHLTEGFIQSYLAKLKKTVEIVVEHTTVTEEEDGSRDLEDNRVLAAAVDGAADYLVTRNIIHFPKTFQGPIVIAPDSFLHLLRQQ